MLIHLKTEKPFDVKNWLRKSHLGFSLILVTPEKEYALFSDFHTQIPSSFNITVSPQAYFKIELVGTISGSKAHIPLKYSPFTAEEKIEIDIGIGDAYELLVFVNSHYTIGIVNFASISKKIFNDINCLICWELKSEPELPELPCLTELHLCFAAFKQIRFTNNFLLLKTLSIVHCLLLTDVTDLAGLEQLLDLSILGCVNLSDIGSLGNLVNLKNLEIIDSLAVKDFEVIGYISHLQKLIIHGNLHTPNFLSNLKDLKQLNISYDNTITNLDPLSVLTNLTELNVSCCSLLTNINGISNLTELTKLTLSWCGELADISPVANLKNLTFLDLSLCTSLKDIVPIANLKKLKHLDLSFCKTIEVFTPIANLVELRLLNICGMSELLDIDFISELTELNNLNLSWCTKLDNVNGLFNLLNVKTLDLSFCSALTNIDGVCAIDSLIYLNLCFCQTLEDIDALIGLVNLETLLLSGCENLESLTGIANLTKLQELDLSYCDRLESLLGREYLTNLSRDVLENLFKFAATWGSYEPKDIVPEAVLIAEDNTPQVIQSETSEIENQEAISSDAAEFEYLELARELYASGELSKDDKLLLTRRAEELGLSRETKLNLIQQAKSEMEDL